MYARSTTVRGNPQKVDDLIAYVRDEAMPAMAAMSGNVGMSMLCDRESGRCIVTSAWADESAMHATEQSVVDLRERAAAIAGGDYGMQAWEIVVLHRAHEGHDGARARVIWADGDPARIDENTSTFRMAMMPRMEELPGFCSVSVFADRATGRGAMTIVYDSQEDMDRGADMARAMRDEFSNAMGLTITDMADFDLAVHHLRVPETV
jgi:heme-degrading monooxygenase HmoA